MTIFISRFLLLSLFFSPFSAQPVKLNEISIDIENKIDASKHQNNSENVKLLRTDGYCWIHKNGKLCFQGSTFLSITINNDEELYEKFDSDQGKFSSYWKQNTQHLLKDVQTWSLTSSNKKVHHATSDVSWAQSLNQVKYGCQIEELDYYYFDPNDKQLIETYGDHSSLWKFHDWIISVDQNMIPISVMAPTITKDNNENRIGNPLEVLFYIEDVVLNTFEIEECDPELEGSESPELPTEVHDRFLKIMDAQDLTISDDEYFGNKEEGWVTRKLDWISDISKLITNTNWCGPLTDRIATPCPDQEQQDIDFFADNACRRHDHTKKYERTSIGLPRSECFSDYDLLQAGGHNKSVKAVYGEEGVMALIGCYNYESVKRWYFDGWTLKYGSVGKKWVIKLGFDRYDNIVKTEGYIERPKECPYDYLLAW